ncbi:methyltransferase family protein [Kineothrix sp. MB12-C1]|uniref:methyltransferase family protein n=1 Tax=Kineothrix sp. MB12-C1 TaxID=3070215 RepID=UPI0027D31295|nr:isoprenylcysteine carboxylmethyltransferase family protein [Kineothrix sp. MB12-C1]WMC93540.1 isoprenylcysteine carboxylmethyltransferase family protein [Kineothrix sp. MB12-C1]
MDVVQMIGFILWIVFYGSYFVKIYKEKKQGISVNRMARGIKSLATKIVEVFLIVITYAMAVVQLLSLMFYGKWALVFQREGVLVTSPVSTVIGTIIAVLGIIFFVTAMREMRDNWRAGIDESQETDFVTEGIYKISRNPAFVGFDLFYIGYGIIFSNGLQVLFVLLGLMTLHMQIRQEEKYMEKKHAGSYLAYRKRVRRYL